MITPQIIFQVYFLLNQKVYYSYWNIIQIYVIKYYLF